MQTEYTNIIKYALWRPMMNPYTEVWHVSDSKEQTHNFNTYEAAKAFVDANKPVNAPEYSYFKKGERGR